MHSKFQYLYVYSLPESLKKIRLKRRIFLYRFRLVRKTTLFAN